MIPRDIREKLGLQEGTGLLVFRIGDSIILKTAREVTPEGMTSSLEAIRRKIRELRITRRDVRTEVKAVRKKEQKAGL